jgi:dihydrofolate synthase/folylpolyglutamate synthase
LNYQEAIQFLYDLRLFGVKFGLDNTRRLAASAGHPEEKLRFIHVAGTNGKGSTCAMLESIYRAAGWRVGLFTSPHLVSFVERIQINRKPIEPADVSRLVDKMRNDALFSAEEESRPTFFEVVTVMALKYFAEQQCELVILETGLGGRLDATNIVRPLASVITNVQFDHQQWLGQTLPEIAREKAGIIKPGVPIITATDAPDALQVIIDTAKELRSSLTIVNHKLDDFEIALGGEHQRMNAAVAVKVTEILATQFPVTEVDLRRGLKEAHWEGRLQAVVRNGQTILLDGAHNPAGAQAMVSALPSRYSLVLGMMGDKDCAAICKILATAAEKIFLVPVDSERSADPSSLANYCRAANPDAPVLLCHNVAEAFAKAAVEPFLAVTGSLYLIGEALEYLGLATTSSERGLNENAGGPVETSIRAVTFDVGGTLIEPWPSVGHVYAQAAQRAGVDISPDILNQRFAAAWQARKNFRYSLSDWKELVDQTFEGLIPAPVVTEFFSELYHQFARAEAWRIYDDVVPCLEHLRNHGCKLGIISNWDERLRPLLEALDLTPYFDAIVISSEVGCHKPDPAIFRAAARELATSPAAILHLGDSTREDYEGAKAAGLQSILLTRPLQSLTNLILQNKKSSPPSKLS